MASMDPPMSVGGDPPNNMTVAHMCLGFKWPISVSGLKLLEGLSSKLKVAKG